MTKMEYIYHTDAAHGWLRVNITELQRLNLMNKITPYSYRLGNYAYLEEDADASKFINKKKQLNEKYTIKEKDDGNYSPIRGYPPFANPTISPSHHASKRKKGWHYESARHSLARKGIKTKTSLQKTIPTSLQNDYLEAYHYDTWSVTNEGIYDAYGVIHPELSRDEIIEMNPTDMREELVEFEDKKAAQGKISAKDMKDYIASMREVWGWKRGMEAP